MDRFLAQHIAVGYYFMTVVMYLLSPRMACMLSIPFNVDFQLYALCFCVVPCHFNHTLLSIIHLWREWASIKLEA